MLMQRTRALCSWFSWWMSEDCSADRGVELCAEVSSVQSQQTDICIPEGHERVPPSLPCACPPLPLEVSRLSCHISFFSSSSHLAALRVCSNYLPFINFKGNYVCHRLVIVTVGKVVVAGRSGDAVIMDPPCGGAEEQDWWRIVTHSAAGEPG